MLLSAELIYDYSQESKQANVFPMTGAETDLLLAHIAQSGQHVHFLNPQYKFPGNLKASFEVFASLMKCITSEVLMESVEAAVTATDNASDGRAAAINSIFASAERAAPSALSRFHVVVAVRIFEFCWHVPFGEPSTPEFGSGGKTGASYVVQSRDVAKVEDVPSALFRHVVSSLTDKLEMGTRSEKDVAQLKADVLCLEYDPSRKKFRSSLGVGGFVNEDIFGEHMCCFLSKETDKCRPSRTISQKKQMDSAPTFPMCVREGKCDGLACELEIMKKVKSVCSKSVGAYQELSAKGLLQPVPVQLRVNRGTLEERKDWLEAQRETAAGKKQHRTPRKRRRVTAPRHTAKGRRRGVASTNVGEEEGSSDDEGSL
jgi:hypothetical protein